MQFLVESDIDTLVLPVAPDVSAVDVWGIVKDGLSGVWGGVDMRADETDNPSGDGILWPGIVRAGARYLGLVFAHRSHSSALAEMQARARIAGLLRRELRVQFDGPLGLQETTGFIKAMPDFEHVDMHTCTCGIVIVCPDPHWYGLPKIIRGSWGSNSAGGLEYPLYAPGVTTRESRRNLMIYPRTTAVRAVGDVSVAAAASQNGWGVVASRAIVADGSTPSGSGYVARILPSGAGKTISTLHLAMTSSAALLAAEGATYTGSIYVRPSIDISMQPMLRFSKLTTPVVGNLKQEVGGTQMVLAGQWSRLSVSSTAPATTTNAQVFLYAAAATDFPAGTTLDMDACLIEQSGVLGDYFDGAMPGAEWTGDPDASESVEYETVRTGDYSGGYLYYSGVQTGHRVDVPNDGLEPSWPILRVLGATSWARFTCGTQVVEVQAQTEGLTIDTKTGEVTSQGVDVSGFLTRDDFFQIPAGGATVSFQASDPVEFEVEASPAWL